MLTKIDTIHTPCKKCVFADYRDNTQIDCYLDLINDFRKKNIEILEAYDEDKEFFIVNGKKCYGYKEAKYFDNRDMGSSTIDEKVAYIKNTFKINYVVSINLIKFTLEEIDEIIASLTNHAIPPKKIILVRYQDDKDVYTFSNLKNILDKHNPREWRIQTVLDREQEYISILHNIVNINRNNFVLSINGNYDQMCNILDYAQKTIYENLGKFIVLSNKNKETIFFNRAVYKASFANGKDILTDYNEYEIL